MNEIGKFSAKILFYLVAAVLLLWTASLTVAFVGQALPGMPWYIPYLSLVIFDGGMIAWLYVFLRYAQGTGQRATAIIAMAVNFLGVGLMVLAEVLLGGQTLVSAPEGLGSAAIWGIALWTVINVGAVLFFHISDPEAQKQMSIQNEKDAIWRGALQQLASMRQQHSQQLTADLGTRLYKDLLDELFVDTNQNGRPDLFEQPGAPALPAGGTAVPSPTPPKERDAQPWPRPEVAPYLLKNNDHDLAAGDSIGELIETAKDLSRKYGINFGNMYIVDRKNGEEILWLPEYREPLTDLADQIGAATKAIRRPVPNGNGRTGYSPE